MLVTRGFKGQLDDAMKNTLAITLLRAFRAGLLDRMTVSALIRSHRAKLHSFAFVNHDRA